MRINFFKRNLTLSACLQYLYIQFWSVRKIWENCYVCRYFWQRHPLKFIYIFHDFSVSYCLHVACGQPETRFGQFIVTQACPHHSKESSASSSCFLAFDYLRRLNVEWAVEQVSSWWRRYNYGRCGVRVVAVLFWLAAPVDYMAYYGRSYYLLVSDWRLDIRAEHTAQYRLHYSQEPSRSAFDEGRPSRRRTLWVAVL